MGRYYAQHDGEHAEVAEALREQYLPRFAGDELPGTPTGMAVAIADKLDTIAGIYATGQKPTGTRDPFGLRRAALGLLRISIERGLDLDLQQLIVQALGSLPFKAPEAAATEVYDYIIERLRAYYVEGGAGITVTPEMFDAVLATRPASALDFDARCGTRAIPAIARRREPGGGDKRIANILRSDRAGRRDVRFLTLIDPAEQILAEQVVAIAREVEPKFAAAITHRRSSSWPRCARQPTISSTRSWSWPTTRGCARTVLRSSTACVGCSCGLRTCHDCRADTKNSPAGERARMQWIRSLVLPACVPDDGLLRRDRAHLRAAAAYARAALRDPARLGKVCTWMAGAVCNLRYTIEGQENLPSQPFISLWKHSSAWETMAQMFVVPPASWLLKREVIWIPIVAGP